MGLFEKQYNFSRELISFFILATSRFCATTASDSSMKCYPIMDTKLRVNGSEVKLNWTKS